MNYEQLMELPWEEFVAQVLQNGPKNTTWYEVRDWLKTQYTAEQIAHMYVKLDKQLLYFVNNPGNPKEDELRDCMDIFWYSTKQELIEQLLDGI